MIINFAIYIVNSVACFNLIITIYGKNMVKSENSDDCPKGLTVINDGPVTLDVPITFRANLTCYSNEKKYLYVFEDNAMPAHKLELSGNESVSATFIYSERTYRPRQYQMKIMVYNDLFLNGFEKPLLHLKLASKKVMFNVTEFIPGEINLSGIITRKDDDHFYVASGTTVNMTIAIHYPQHVYEESEMSYSWSIDDDQYITTIPFNDYKFTKTGTFIIRVTVVARIPLYDNKTKKGEEVKYKWGHYYKEVMVKDPFYSVNLTGNTYLQHGQLFNLDVSCNGSGPFEYCWKVFLPQDNITNLTCSSPVVTNQCSFPIIYYFHESGKYHVVIRVDNLVTDIERDIEVIVYDVSLRPQLSTVIIPVICSILVLFIIATGVMLHVRHNQHLDIETADFDFLQSESCVVETSWERLYHSIVKFLGFCTCRKRPLNDSKMSTLPYESFDY